MQSTTSYPQQMPEEYNAEEEGNINYNDALSNLQKIMKVEKQGLRQMEADNEVLRGANNKSMTTTVSRASGSLKSSRKNELEEDRKVNKLRVEN